MSGSQWRLQCLLVLSFCASSALPVHAGDEGASRRAPVVPGLQQAHPLSQREIGDLLIGELRCAACHGSSIESRSVEIPAAPDLSEVGGRVDPDFLQRFLIDPARTVPGTRMPQVLTGRDLEEQTRIAEALTHFLVSRASMRFARAAVDPTKFEVGKTLFHSVGCVACHGAREKLPHSHAAPAPEAVGLEHVGQKYSSETLANFLFQPEVVRPSGRMPDMGLSASEASAIASYLIGPEISEPTIMTLQPELVEEGARLYGILKCAACHEPDEAGAHILSRFSGPRLDAKMGCLSDEPIAAPDFALSGEQRSAIAAALTGPRAEPTDEERIAAKLTSFNCIACHVRDDYGGVHPGLNAHFQTSEHDLGDHARIPPQLTLVGAKLRTEWLQRVLLDAARVRPYMHTRMPQYGASNMAELPELFASVDHLDPVSFTPPTGDARREAHDAGRELLGIRGLACISCHDFNSKPSPGFGGIDLITTCDRLEPAWFVGFLIAPATYRPGIVMPQSWPGGVAAHNGILEGDTDKQLEAIWHFLSLGRSANDPEGIRTPSTVLEVADRARTYRGRSSIAGYRGIAVGFPGGASYAFDARTGSLSAIWTGGFVSVRWNGQGAGGFNPRGERPVELPRAITLLALADDEAAWPLRPVMTEEQPVDPDPRYPSQHGYRFKGYTLDAESIPTFTYRSGEVLVSDRSEFLLQDEQVTLRRSLRFEAPTAQTLFMRALVGELEQASPGEFNTAALRLKLPEVTTLLRPIEGDDSQSELLLKLALPEGAMTITIDYELL